MSVARVSIWGITVGYLAWDGIKHHSIFEPDAEYVKSDFNLAPILHPQKKEILYGNDFHEKFEGLIPVFKDSLPDAFGNVVFKEWLEQSGLKESDMNPVERLLYVGRRGMGALEYHVEKGNANVIQNIDLEELSTISDLIIKRKYESIGGIRSLENILKIGASVGGAQAKILVAKRRGTEEYLAGDIVHDGDADYYIIKLGHDTSQIWHREKNVVEFIYNQIAREIGLNVPESELIFQGERVHFQTKRFDRVNNVRWHTQTVSAMAGFYGRTNEFGYENIFKIIDFLKLSDDHKKQLFLNMIFNVAASNRDDHTKNFSFLMSPLGEWAVSPAYDLTYPVDPFQNFGMVHKITVNGKDRNIDRSDILQVADKIGLIGAHEMIDKVISGVNGFRKMAQSFDINKKTVDIIDSELQKNIMRLTVNGVR